MGYVIGPTHDPYTRQIVWRTLRAYREDIKKYPQEAKYRDAIEKQKTAYQLLLREYAERL